MTPRRQHASRPAVAPRTRPAAASRPRFAAARRPAAAQRLRSLAQRVQAFLRDTRGFMLAEQLISVIFIGLLCVAVAAGLQAALSSYSAITAQTAADTLLSNAVEVVSNELTYALDVDDAGESSPSGSPAFVSATTHSKVTMATNASAGIVLNPASGEAGGTPMTLAASNASAGLNVSISFGGYNAETNKALPAYDQATKTWNFTIQIQRADAQGTAGVLAKTTMTVKRIG